MAQLTNARRSKRLTHFGRSDRNNAGYRTCGPTSLNFFAFGTDVMTRVASQPIASRVLHAIVVASCIACSLALVGAVHIERNASAPVKFVRPATPAASVQPKPLKIDPASVASIAKIAPTIEVLRDTLPTKAIAIEPPAPPSRVVRMEVTAYCPCTKCCGPSAQGITASGKRVNYNNGKFVAADTSRLPFGTRVVIPGYASSEEVEVIDRGGAIKGNKLDLYFPTHAEALVWGRQHVDVTIYE